MGILVESHGPRFPIWHKVVLKWDFPCCFSVVIIRGSCQFFFHSGRTDKWGMFGLGGSDERKVTAWTLSEQNHNARSNSSGIPVNPTCAVLLKLTVWDVSSVLLGLVGSHNSQSWHDCYYLVISQKPPQRLDPGLDFSSSEVCVCRGWRHFHRVFPLSDGKIITFPAMFKLPVWVVECGQLMQDQNI